MRRAVKLGKEFFVQAATEILFDIASVLHNGAKQHEQNQTCLRELARLQAGVIAVRLGIRVSGDPAAGGFPHLLEIVKPMGSHAQCVADQGPDNRAGGTFPNRCSRAQCLTMTLARKVMMLPDFPGRDPGRGAKLVRGISVPAGLRLLKKVDGITRRLSVFAA